MIGNGEASVMSINAANTHFCWRSALRAWSRCQPVVAHDSSRITAWAPFDADQYRVAFAFVTALRWLIVSPMVEAVPTDPAHPHRRTATRAFLHAATNRLRGHFW
jgi:hypothetical protein